MSEKFYKALEKKYSDLNRFDKLIIAAHLTKNLRLDHCMLDYLHIIISQISTENISTGSDLYFKLSLIAKNLEEALRSVGKLNIEDANEFIRCFIQDNKKYNY